MTTGERFLSLYRGKSDRDRELLRRVGDTFDADVLTPDEGETFPWGDRRAVAPSHVTYRGVWNWDSAFHAIAIARIDPDWAREQIAYFLENPRADGCFVDCYEALKPFPEIGMTQSKPPIIYAACELIDRRGKDDTWLRFAYERLCNNEKFLTEKRCEDGLFFYNGDAEGDWNNTCAKWESGWDNSPRFDGDITNQIWAIDLNCYMVRAYRSLAYIAERLGKTCDIAAWKQKEIDLTARILARLWDGRLGCFCDTYRPASGKSGATGVITPASFLPLFVGIATGEQANAMAKIASDPNKFFPLMPSCAYDTPVYESHHYWRGPVWLNLAYMAIKGLWNYGYRDLADGFRQRMLDMCHAETRSLFEYYDSRTGKGLGAPDYGWTAVFVEELILNEAWN